MSSSAPPRRSTDNQGSHGSAGSSLMAPYSPKTTAAPRVSGHLCGAELRRRFIEKEPEEPECLCGLGELGEVHRLANVCVRAERVAPGDVLLLLGGREHHDRQTPRPLVSP